MSLELNDEKYVNIQGQQFKVYEMNNIDRQEYVGFIYVTLNKVNNMKYIGQHRSWMKNYIGTGSKFYRSEIDKYGTENFQRYIIDIAKDYEELEEKEANYINNVFNAVYSKDWYNIRDGGQKSGYVYAGYSEEQKKEIYKKMGKSVSGKNNGMYKKGYKIAGDKNGMRTKDIDFSGDKNPFYNKKHSKEAIEKMKKFQSENCHKFHFKQPYKFYYADGSMIKFESLKDLCKFMKEKYDLSQPTVMRIVNMDGCYKPKNKGFEAKGIRIEKMLSELEGTT